MRGLLLAVVCYCLVASGPGHAADPPVHESLPVLLPSDASQPILVPPGAEPAPGTSAPPGAAQPAPVDKAPPGDALPSADKTPPGNGQDAKTEEARPAEAKCEEDKLGNFFKQGDYKFQIGGQYRVNPNFSNFPFQPVTLSPDNESGENFAQQRLRLWLTAVIDEHIEGYVQVQIGGFLWGQNYEFAKSFVGPRFPPRDDRVGILLRRGWISYHDDECGKFRIGILDWHDSFGDTLASSDYDFNVAGVDWTQTFPELGNMKAWLGAFVMTDLALLQTDLPVGNHNALLFTSDFDWKCGDRSSFGFSTYGMMDNGQYSYPTLTPYRSSWDLWVGARAATCFGDFLPVNGFVLYNGGQREDLDGSIFRHNGMAVKLEAGPLEIGPGKLSAQMLYASGSHTPGEGNSAEFRTIAQTYRDNFGAQGYWGYLYITAPNPPSDVKDLGVSLQNRGLGLYTIQGKYVYPLTCKLSGLFAAGWTTAVDPNPISGNRVIGPEVANQFIYNFGHGLTVDLGVSVLFTGDFYRAGPTAPRPNDLYEAFSRVQLEF